MAEIQGLEPDSLVRGSDWYANVPQSLAAQRLAVVGDVEWRQESWSFDSTRVWRDQQTGLLYMAHDSGCSCPSPYSDTTVADLQPIARMQDLLDELAKRQASCTGYNYELHEYGPQPLPAAAIDEFETMRITVDDLLRSVKVETPVLAEVLA